MKARIFAHKSQFIIRVLSICEIIIQYIIDGFFFTPIEMILQHFLCFYQIELSSSAESQDVMIIEYFVSINLSALHKLFYLCQAEVLHGIEITHVATLDNFLFL